VATINGTIVMKLVQRRMDMEAKNS